MIERPIDIEQNSTNGVKPFHDTDNPEISERRLFKKDPQQLLNKGGFRHYTRLKLGIQKLTAF
jgi:hypothetical protein